MTRSFWFPDTLQRFCTNRYQNHKETKRYVKIHVHPHYSCGKIFSRPKLRQLAQAAQQDPVVKGYRSFCNLAEGKAVCVMEAPDKDAMAAWFKKMGMPFDSITKVELEGERGNIQPV